MIDDLKVRRKSPNFPSFTLERALELAQRVYKAAFESGLDTATVVELMGFKGISGASRTALATLKQFGLLEGRDFDNRITKLASQIFHPLEEAERISAIVEASRRPAIFQGIYEQFKGNLPDDKILTAYLIRNHGFSGGGAAALIKSLRETESFVAPFKLMLQRILAENESDDQSIHDDPDAIRNSGENAIALDRKLVALSQEVLRVRLTPSASATVTFEGEVTQKTIERLIAILEISKDGYPTV